MENKAAEPKRKQTKKKGHVLDSKERAIRLMKDKAIVTVKEKPELSEYESLIDLSAQAPRAVIALLSALQFHELTTENSHKIWGAYLRGQRIPKVDYPPTRPVIFSEKAF